MRLTQTHIILDGVAVDFPFKCPHCGRMITNRDDVRAFQGYATTRYYVEHIAPGCIFLVREVEGHQVMPGGESESSGAGTSLGEESVSETEPENPPPKSDEAKEVK